MNHNNRYYTIMSIAWPFLTIENSKKRRELARRELATPTNSPKDTVRYQLTNQPELLERQAIRTTVTRISR